MHSFFSSFSFVLSFFCLILSISVPSFPFLFINFRIMLSILFYRTLSSFLFLFSITFFYFLFLLVLLSLSLMLTSFSSRHSSQFATFLVTLSSVITGYSWSLQNKIAHKNFKRTNLQLKENISKNAWKLWIDLNRSLILFVFTNDSYKYVLISSLQETIKVCRIA